MFGASYYNGVIRKYIIMFGSMFNDIDVQRFNANGTRIQTLRVPIAYGPKEKFLVRLASDPNLDKDVAISLPRMSFELIDMAYNPTRKLPATTKNKAVSATDADTMFYQYTPVPYDFNMQLSIFVKNADDGVQILEQILPYFAPEWTNTVNLIPSMHLKVDVPTVLTSVTTEDTYEGDYAVRRALIHNLNFVIKGYVYGPVRSTGVIKRSIINSIINTSVNSTVTVEPGLTANSTPTSDANISVPSSQITANTDYGFLETIDFSSSGR